MTRKSTDDASTAGPCELVRRTLGVLLDGPDGAYREPSDDEVVEAMDHCVSCGTCDRMLERVLETAVEDHPRSAEAKSLLSRALRLTSARMIGKLGYGLGTALGPVLDGLLELGLRILADANASKRVASRRDPSN